MSNIKELWDNGLVRGLVILSALGFVPFFMLSKAAAALGA